MRPLVRVRVDGVLRPHLAWAEGRTVSLPADLAARWGRDGRLRLPLPEPGADPGHDVDELRTRAAFTERTPLGVRLGVRTARVPERLRSLLARGLGRVQAARQARWARYPDWPLDLSADFLQDLLAPAPSPWAGGPAPVLLTHDLDSPAGLASLVGRFLAREEARGARSTSFFVPAGWPLDHGALGEVRARGHELGIHGWDHCHRTPFAPPVERLARIEGARPLVERYAIEGYRAPSLWRTRALLRDLGRLYRWDSSVPTSGGPFPVGNNGCASARPFRLEGILELPLSLPRDGSLRFLGVAPAEVAATWIRCAEEVAAAGGVVVLLTHCEERFSGGPAMLAAYERFLDHVAASPRLRFARTGEVLARAPGPGGPGPAAPEGSERA